MTIRQSLASAIVTMLAALATLACAMIIDPEPGPAVLAVVLCLSFSRSHLNDDLRGRLEAAIMLPVVGLVTAGLACCCITRLGSVPRCLLQACSYRSGYGSSGRWPAAPVR